MRLPHQTLLNLVLRLILLIVRRLDHGASPSGLWASDLDSIYQEYLCDQFAHRRQQNNHRLRNLLATKFSQSRYRSNRSLEPEKSLRPLLLGVHCQETERDQ